MAREEPRFKFHMKLNHDFSVTPIGSHAIFQLQIRMFLTDDDGNIVGEGAADGLQDRSVLLEIEFGRQRHRRHVVNLLRAAGWRDESSLETILDAAFSDSKLKLERDKTGSRSRGIPTIIFCVVKFVRWEVELPKPLPATRESIQALKKVKLEANVTEECVICME